MGLIDPSSSRNPVRSGLAPALAGVGLLVLLLGGCAEQRLDWLPYEFVAHERAGLQPIETSYPGPMHLWYDFDGDGLEEAIFPDNKTLVARFPDSRNHQIIWQHPFRPPFHLHRPVAVLSAGFDLEGDGRPDLLATARDTLSLRWTTHVLDPRSGELRATFELTATDGRYPDGRWDGFYTPIGGVPGGRRGDLVVFTASAGYDVEGRRILAVEPTTGEEAWSVDLGPTPIPTESRIVDLAGDGTREILVATSGVRNREPGETIAGASDDSCHVYLLDQRGRTLWRYAEAEAPSGTQTELGDVDADGVLDVIVGSGCHAEGRGVLRIHDGRTGRVLGEIGCDRIVLDILVTEATPGAVRLLATFHDGSVVEYGLSSAGEFSVRRRVVFEQVVSRLETADLYDREPDPLLAQLSNGGVALIDRQLCTLALLPHGGMAGRDIFHVWRLVDGSRRLFAGSHPLQSFSLRRARWPWFLGLGAVAVVLPAGWLVARRRIRRPTSAAMQHQLRLQLLDRLKTIRHGRFGTLEDVRRLEWHVQGALELDPDLAVPSARIVKLARDTEASTLARLQEIVALAPQAAIVSHRVESLAESCRELAQQLARCQPETRLDLSRFLAEIKKLNQTLEVDSARIRDDVEACFTADLPDLIARVLRAHEPALAATAVSVELQGEPVDPGEWTASGSLLVTGDADDLAFVIDNLVDNAIRAMEGVAERRLVLAWTATGLSVTLQIEDTGCGIPPEDWQTVLAGDGSTRPGGGFGFKKSATVLARFRGSLEIVASRPGRGTVFELTLPAATTEAGGEPANQRPAAKGHA